MMPSRLLLSAAAAIAIAGLSGCKSGTSYEDGFVKFANDLEPFSNTGDTEAQGEARDKRLREGAPQHKSYLIEQLKSDRSGNRWLACRVIPFAKSPEAGPKVFALAKSDTDVMTRMGAIEALGHLRDKDAEDYIRSMVNAPKRSETWVAITALYRIDPKGAVAVFKKRAELPDVRQPKKGYEKVLMAAYVLDSDPVKESALVLKWVDEIRTDSGASTYFYKLEKDALSHRHPSDVIGHVP